MCFKESNAEFRQSLIYLNIYMRYFRCLILKYGLRLTFFILGLVCYKVRADSLFFCVKVKGVFGESG